MKLALGLVAAALLVPAVVADPVTSLSFVACVQSFAGFPVPIESVQAMLPSGFTAQKFTLDPTGATGTISIYTEACDNATVGAETLEDVGQAWLIVRTIPPAAWTDPDATAHFFITDGVITSEALAAVYDAWGLGGDLELGAVSITRTSPLAGAYVETSLAGASNLAFEMRSENARPSLVWPEQHIRFFARDPEGNVNAFDKHDRQGAQSGVQTSEVTFTTGFDALGPAYVGVGREFRWAPRQVSWTTTPVDLPPLA